MPEFAVSSGGGGGGGAVTIADGADVVEGALADAAITSDAAGTLSGKLRGLVKIFADIWNSVTHSIGVHNDVLTAAYDAVNQHITISGTVTTKTDLTPAAPATASVGVASAQAVAANGNRSGLILVNASNARISLGFGASAAVLDSGITLYPGGTFELDEYCFDRGAINAIASVAASTLAIQEFNA